MLLILLNIGIYAQEYRVIKSVDQDPVNPSWMETLFDDHTLVRLEKAIKKTAQKQMIYSYNIANASTPDFVPILLEEDLIKIKKVVDKTDDELLSQVFVELLMTYMGENNKKQQALYAIYKKQTENMRKIVSFGKQ